jgi:uncharacterized coiled-coil DUF342 family protein
MTDPKDTTIEVLCAQVARLRARLPELHAEIESIQAQLDTAERESDTYRDENEKLRAMVAEFRMRINDHIRINREANESIRLGDYEFCLGVLDDCERVAFAETSESGK